MFRVTFWAESKAIVLGLYPKHWKMFVVKIFLESTFLESKTIVLVDCTQNIQKCLEPTFEHKVRL